MLQVSTKNAASTQQDLYVFKPMQASPPKQVVSYPWNPPAAHVAIHNTLPMAV